MPLIETLIGQSPRPLLARVHTHVVNGATYTLRYDVLNDFEKNEVALTRYLRGVGFKVLQRIYSDGVGWGPGAALRKVGTLARAG